MLAVSIAGALLMSSPSRRQTTQKLDVEVTYISTLLAPDARGTVASAMIDNPNPVPVDVTIRVRWYNLLDKFASEETLKPYRNLQPGSRRTIQTHISTTPLKTATFEAIKVEPTTKAEF